MEIYRSKSSSRHDSWTLKIFRALNDISDPLLIPIFVDRPHASTSALRDSVSKTSVILTQNREIDHGRLCCRAQIMTRSPAFRATSSAISGAQCVSCNAKMMGLSCKNTVTTIYKSGNGGAFIFLAYQLYLPGEWTSTFERREGCRDKMTVGYHHLHLFVMVILLIFPPRSH